MPIPDTNYLFALTITSRSLDRLCKGRKCSERACTENGCPPSLFRGCGVSGQRVTELRRLPPSPCGMKETLGKPWAGQDLEVNCRLEKAGACFLGDFRRPSVEGRPASVLASLAPRQTLLAPSWHSLVANPDTTEVQHASSPLSKKPGVMEAHWTCRFEKKVNRILSFQKPRLMADQLPSGLAFSPPP